MNNLTGSKRSLIKKTTRTLFACVLLLGFLAIGCSGDKTAEKTPADYVNPFVDTHKSQWLYFSSASRPFGMVNLSPDTDTKGSWNSGYLYDSPYIRCFSHIHGWQISGIAVMPTVGEMNGHLGMDVYKSRFTHEEEIAQPGYHKVYLQDYDVWAELTSTTRVGFHRYTFPESNGVNILFDVGAYLAHGPTAWSEVIKVNDRELEGKAVMAGTVRRPKDFPVYFVARFSKAFDEFGGWEEKQLKGLPVEYISGKDAGAYVRWGKTEQGEEIMV
jgi:putative alpha-1,2-mannosidase